MANSQINDWQELPQDWLTQLVPDQAPQYQINDWQELPAGQDMGMGRAALQGFNAAVPFGERLVAGLGALGASAFTGENVGDLYNEARRNQKATETANPNAYLGGALTGVAATLPIGLSRAVSSTPVLGKAANALQNAATATGNFVRGGQVATDAGILSRAANLAGRSARSAAVAAPTAGLYGYGSGEEGNRLENAASNAGMAATVGAALPVAGAGLGLAASALNPKIQEGLLPVVELAQKYKIPVSLSQVSEGNALKNLQKTTKELPFSGEAGFREQQMKSFNNALIKTVGGNANKFSPELMDNLFTRVGNEFDALGRGKTFDLNKEFLDAVATIEDEGVKTGVTKEALTSLDKNFQEIINNSQNGKIKGKTLGKLRATINSRARKASASDTQEILHDLENALVDTMTAGDDAASGTFSKAKQQYKNLLILEPLAQKAKGGNISPSQLQDRVSKIYGRQFTRGKAGEIGDLARIGHELLPELNGSDTTQKGLYALGGLNAIMNPGTIPLMATGLTAGRAFQSGINRNQALVRSVANKSRIAANANKAQDVMLPDVAISPPQDVFTPESARIPARQHMYADIDAKVKGMRPEFKQARLKMLNKKMRAGIITTREMYERELLNE